MSGTRGPLSQGTPEEREARGLDPAPDITVEVEIPTCPTILTGEARREWTRITRLLASQGRIAGTDRAVLTAYCEAWRLYRLVTKAIETDLAKFEGGDDEVMALISLGPSGYKPDVRVDLQRKYLADLTATSKELGLSVSTRLRLPATEAPKGADPYDELNERRKERERRKAEARARGEL